MKKHCISILIVAIIFMLAACKTENSQARTNDPQYKENGAYTQISSETEASLATAPSEEDQAKLQFYLTPDAFPILIDSNKNYEIYSDEARYGYYYRIFSNQGDQIAHGYSTYKFSGIEAIDDSLLVLKENNSMALFSAQYFDVENGRISRVYPKPLGACSDLVAYFTNDEEANLILVVRDLFDVDKFYCEFKDDSFSTSVYMTSCTATFSEDHSSVTIYYPHPTTYETITKTFPLTGQSNPSAS